jgi:hypothetical protein
MNEEERMKILEMIEAGTISAEEGLRLLQTATDDADSASPEAVKSPDPASRSASFLEFSFDSDEKETPTAEPGAEVIEPGGFEEARTSGSAPRQDQTFHDTEEMDDRSFEPLPADVEKWRRWWMAPLWVGVVVTVLSGMWMYSSFTNQGFSFWFACSWFPFMLGVGMMALSYASRRSRWLHVRVQQKPGERPQNIAISMPLPLGLATWFFRYFGQFIPDLPDIRIDEILRAVSDSTGPENPFYVEVDEGSNGEKVKVYIG